nr:rhodanese-like domain-containing protein [Cellulomonas denverensis]
MTPQQAWRTLADDPSVLLVDVRTEGEWRTIGVPDLPERVGFVEWVDGLGRPNPRFVEQLTELGAGDGRPVLFLCRSGVRSIAAATAATAAGIGPSYNILTGFEGDVGPDGERGHAGWRAEGLPWRAL